jgi:hypothetical protein
VPTGICNAGHNARRIRSPKPVRKVRACPRRALQQR